MVDSFSIKKVAITYMTESNEILPAVLLDESHARLVSEKEKTGFVKSEKYRRFVGKEIFVVADDEIWAKIKFASPRKVSLKKFKALESDHRISAKEREDRWPGVREFFFYKFEILEVYSPPLGATGINGARVFASGVGIVKEEPEPKPEPKPRPRPAPVKEITPVVEPERMNEDIRIRVPDPDPPPVRGRRLGDYLDGMEQDEIEAVLMEGVEDPDRIVPRAQPTRQREPAERLSKSSKINELRAKSQRRVVVQEPELVKQVRKQSSTPDILDIFKRKLEEGK